MKIDASTYPQAGDEGKIQYRQSVPLDGLRAALAQAFPGQDLDWDRRSVIVHGVPADAGLPESAQSLPGVPAHVTLPIACGTLAPQ